jgi:hypothetical protein
LRELLPALRTKIFISVMIKEVNDVHIYKEKGKKMQSEVSEKNYNVKCTTNQ